MTDPVSERGYTSRFARMVLPASAALLVIARGLRASFQSPKTGIKPLKGTEVGYAQGMGSTTIDGYVAEFPLQMDGNARQVFVDATNGKDSFNGLSPYAGFRANGFGPFSQYGATGKGKEDRTYGPKSTLISAIKSLPPLRPLKHDIGVGHQVLLAESGVYEDWTIEEFGGDNVAALHYGHSAAYPLVWQSYSPVDPWNQSRRGRAPTDRLANIKLTNDRKWNFDHYYNAAHGIISNFAFRGLRFLASDGTRFGSDFAILWANIDSDNILFENVDFGPCKLIVDNTSFSTNNARWSRNLIVRKCLLDRNFSTSDSRLGGAHASFFFGATFEEVIWYHSTWRDDADGRFLNGPNDRGKPNFFRHDLYLAGYSIAPSVVRRCVSIAASLDFLSSRTGVEAYNNVVIDAPAALGAGGGVTNINIEQPNGTYFDIHHNLIMGSDLLNGNPVQVHGRPLASSEDKGGSFLRVGNVEFEFIEPHQEAHNGRHPIVIGPNPSVTATNIATAISARPEPLLRGMVWRVFPDIGSGPEVRQTAKSPGTPLVWVEAYGPGLSVGATQPPQAIAVGNGVLGSRVRDTLIINSGYNEDTHNAPRAGTFAINQGADAITSYASFERIVSQNWGPDDRAGGNVIGKPRSVTTFTDIVASDQSCSTNQDVYRQLGFADRNGLRDAIVSDFTAPWAINILSVVARLCNINPDVPESAQRPGFTVLAEITTVFRPKSSATFSPPKLPENYTFALASTYVGNIPVPGSGVGKDDIMVTEEMNGKRLSRMWVAVKGNGGNPLSFLQEVVEPITQPSPVLVKPVGKYCGMRVLILRALRFAHEEGGYIVLDQIAVRSSSGNVETKGRFSSPNGAGSSKGPCQNLRDKDRVLYSSNFMAYENTHSVEDIHCSFDNPTDVSSITITVADRAYAPAVFRVFLYRGQIPSDGSEGELVVDFYELTDRGWQSDSEREFTTPYKSTNYSSGTDH